jgi:hypothetical protein
VTAGDAQLGLFPAAAPGKPPRRPVTRAHLLLARRAIRAVTARGPLPVTELAAVLGADLGDMWLAVGIAQQWHRLSVCDGYAAAPAHREEGRPS